MKVNKKRKEGMQKDGVLMQAFLIEIIFGRRQIT